MKRNVFLPAVLLASAVWSQRATPESGDSAADEQRGQHSNSDSRGPTDREVGPQIVIPAGAWIRIRVDQALSSDRSQAGERFSGTLTQPLVADGYIVAQRGQTIEGRVTDAVKAGRSKGTSRLGLELLEIGLVDGQQMPVRTQLIEYTGPSSRGRDAAAIGTTTGAGAAIGAAAAGGFGAGMGAIAGAAASTIGVLATRGRATEIHPETVVTFRTLEPITVSTARAPHAFRPVQQSDYDRQSLERRPAPPPRPAFNDYAHFSPYFLGGPGFWYGPGYSFYRPRYYSPRIVVGGHYRGRRR